MMFLSRKITHLAVGVALIISSAQANAILTITITEGGEGGAPIAIVPFSWQGPGALPQELASIIGSDLRRSGRFSPLARKQMPSEPRQDRDVSFKEWRLVKATALVIGSVQRLKKNRYRVEFRLYDVFRERQLAGYRYTVSAQRLRAVAHQMSDVIYQKLTGERGAFSSRIAYVSYERKNGKKRYRLMVADSDGASPQTVVTSDEPLISPAWSPDGKRLAYVSFENKRSMVYIQNLNDGRRFRVAAFKGINSAPAWSPDGKRLAMTLSKDGNPEIYVLHLENKKLQRLTFHRGIDTEPAWSPDGKALVFTSDRSGGPQIYRKLIGGGSAQRLTFDSNYNARASYSPTNNQLTLVTRRNGRYNIGVLALTDNSFRALTDTRLDESPTFSPNGRMVLYATQVSGRGVLASVTADGSVRQLYTFAEGDVREPAWSPYNP